MKQVIASTKQIIITQAGPLAQMVLATREPKIVPQVSEGQTTFVTASAVETTILYFDRESALALIGELQDFLAETEETSVMN